MCLVKIKKPTYFTIQHIFANIHGPTAFFSTIHRSHCTISSNFYIYLQYFQQKIFNFSKISGSQTDPKYFDSKKFDTIFHINYIDCVLSFYCPSKKVKLSTAYMEKIFPFLLNGEAKIYRLKRRKKYQAITKHNYEKIPKFNNKKPMKT